MELALRLRGVEKAYGATAALRGVSLQVPRGSIYGLLGPNGAGKSTLLRIALGVSERDRGAVELLGADPLVDRTPLRRIGYLPEEAALYKRMRVLDTLVFFGRLKGLTRAQARAQGERWLVRVGLADRARARVDSLSKGLERKLQFAACTIHDPELLLLDEPTSGLDPLNQDTLLELLREARREGRTVILSTHHMAQADALCDAVCVLAGGRVLLDGPLAQLRRAHREPRYRVAFESSSESLEKWMLDGAGLLARSERSGGGWTVELAPGVQVQQLLAALARLECPLARLEVVEPDLHEVFVRAVRAAEAQQESADA